MVSEPSGFHRRGMGASPASARDPAAGDPTAVLELEHALGVAERQAQLLHQAELGAIAVAESAATQVSAVRVRGLGAS